MLKRGDQRRLERLARINIQGGLLPSLTLLSDLIKFLNQTKTSPGKRIVMILEKMLELEKMAKQVSPEEQFVVAPLEWGRHRKKYRLHWEIVKRNAILQTELSEYRVTPHAAVVIGGGGSKGPSVWATYWKDDSGLKSKEPLRMTATQALEWILKIAQDGGLTRLRRCAHCQKWLFARFRHQNFCSTECQQKNYTQSDAWKAHRRAYMRHYYQKNFSGKPR